MFTTLLLFFIANANAGPISWKLSASETVIVDFTNLQKISAKLGEQTKISSKKADSLGVECFYKITGSWLTKTQYSEGLTFYCKDKKSGNVFDYGVVTQCNNLDGLHGIASPAVYKNDKNILNVLIQCGPAK